MSDTASLLLVAVALGVCVLLIGVIIADSITDYRYYRDRCADLETKLDRALGIDPCPTCWGIRSSPSIVADSDDNGLCVRCSALLDENYQCRWCEPEIDEMEVYGDD